MLRILNADDIYILKHLNLCNYFKKNIDYIFGSVIKDRLMHGYWPKKFGINLMFIQLIHVFLLKSAHKKLGHDTNFKYSSDRDFIYRLLKVTC